MVLYAKSLGASATILGIVAGMMPLLVIAQIPAAGYIDRIGYKRFVYAGWGTRVLFIAGVALVPLTSSFLDANNRLALIIALQQYVPFLGLRPTEEPADFIGKVRAYAAISDSINLSAAAVGALTLVGTRAAASLSGSP